MFTPMTSSKITVQSTIAADLALVWAAWTSPEHITKWNAASDDWHCPYAENDLRAGGTFKSTMAAKDASLAFDFEGTYDQVLDQTLIAYTLGDGRQVEVRFEKQGPETRVTETFDPENIHPHAFQQAGWQAILDRFKDYVEANLRA